MDKDPLNYMEEAEEKITTFVLYFYVYFSIILFPTDILLSSIVSLTYNNWKYDHIDPAYLYRNHRLV